MSCNLVLFVPVNRKCTVFPKLQCSVWECCLLQNDVLRQGKDPHFTRLARNIYLFMLCVCVWTKRLYIGTRLPTPLRYTHLDEWGRLIDHTYISLIHENIVLALPPSAAPTPLQQIRLRCSALGVATFPSTFFLFSLVVISAFWYTFLPWRNITILLVSHIFYFWITWPIFKTFDIIALLLETTPMSHL